MADTKWSIKGREFVNCNLLLRLAPVNSTVFRRMDIARRSAASRSTKAQHGSTKLAGCGSWESSAGRARSTRARAKPRW